MPRPKMRNWRSNLSNIDIYNRVAKTAKVRVIPLKEAKERLIADLREAGKLA